ncbi:MAG: hypothetical protein ACRDQZ_04555 [Mycobacteriales bacterium]
MDSEVRGGGEGRKALTRKPGSLETYQRQLKSHVLPALQDLRLGEINTPLLDRFIDKIKSEVGTATAKTCRAIVSGSIPGFVVMWGC